MVDRRTELAASVIIGKDNWLFHRDHEAVEQVSGRRRLPDYELRRWRHLLECRHHWLAARGVAYHFFVVPEKHAVYPDKLGEQCVVSEDRPVRQLIREFESRSSPVRIIYPAESLSKARSERDTYLVADTHWNMFGGYVAYRDLCRAVAERYAIPVVEPTRLDYFQLAFDGDLGTRLEPEVQCEGLYFHVRDPRGRKVGENHVFTRGSALAFENEDDTLPKLVLFRDSFANWWLPLLAESFSRVVVVSTMEMYFELVESERPDVVVTQMAERYLNYQVFPTGAGYFPDDHSRIPFDTLCMATPEEISKWTTRRDERAP